MSYPDDEEEKNKYAVAHTEAHITNTRIVYYGSCVLPPRSTAPQQRSDGRRLGMHRRYQSSREWRNSWNYEWRTILNLENTVHQCRGDRENDRRRPQSSGVALGTLQWLPSDGDTPVPWFVSSGIIVTVGGAHDRPHRRWRRRKRMSSARENEDVLRTVPCGSDRGLWCRTPSPMFHIDPETRPVQPNDVSSTNIQWRWYSERYNSFKCCILRCIILNLFVLFSVVVVIGDVAAVVVVVVMLFLC